MISFRTLAALAFFAVAAPCEAATMVSADIWQSLGLHADGTVRSWGNDRRGELGIGTVLFSQVPRRVDGLPPIRAGAASIAADQHVLAIAEDGSVWAWGWNLANQLGDGTSVDRTSPVRVLGLPNAIAVAAGDSHSLAITAGGDVWTWGSNGRGALGDSTIPTICPGACQRDRPGKIGLAGAIAVAAGREHSLALLSDGTVWAFGGNTVGQLGDGTYSMRTDPVRVSGLSGIVAIAANRVHSLALKSDGTVWAWGGNAEGQLGDGTTINRPAPVQVPGVNAVGIAAGGNTSYASLADGTVVAWGGTPLPLPPAVLPGYTQVSVLRAGRSGHSIAVRADGTVWTEGSNDVGQLGRPSSGSDAAMVPGLSGATAVAAGGSVSLARLNDGSLYVWGTNIQGELATARALNRTTPSSVLFLQSVTRIASGGVSLALHADGTVSSWGGGVSTPAPVAGLSGIVRVAAGGRHAVALKSDGTVWTWGTNQQGQLGRGEVREDDQPPAVVPGLAGVTSVAAIQNLSAAVRADGTVWVWGWNDPSGVLGVPATAVCTIDIGTTSCTPTPTQVPGIDSVVEVASSGEHFVALRSDGTVWAWGDNRRGALGVEELTLRPAPAPVAGLANVVQVAAGGSSQSMALTADGTVWTWGDNTYGQLGSAGPGIRTVPAAVEGLANIARVAYGADHALALRADGALWAWGGNSQGQLGDGTFVDRFKPAIVVREEGAGTLDGNDWYLRLDPAATVTLPAAVVPRVLVISRGFRTAEAVSLEATAKYKTAESGTSVNLYVLAQVPPGFFDLVKTAPGAKSAAELRAKTGEALVLAQLTPLGWTNAEGQLIAYSQNVANAAGAGANILDGIRTASIPGARFCIGYGESSDSMLSALTVREVLEIPGATSAASGSPCLLSGVYVGGPASSRLGTSVTFSASVVGLSPTGVVQFFDGATGLPGAIVLTLANEAVGRASITTASLGAGLHAIAASYSGDGRNAAVSAAGSLPLRHTVVAPQAPTGVALSGPASSELGASVAFIAMVTGDRPTGTVQFRDGSVDIGSPVPLVDSVALLRISNLALGGHAINAAYSGDVGNAAGSSNIVPHTVHASLPTRVSLASSANPSALGAAVTLTATVTGTNPSGNVVFRDHTAGVATVPLSNGIAVATLSSLSAGLHVLAAEYLGDASNPAATSPALFQQVTATGASIGAFAPRLDVATSTLVTSNAATVSGAGASAPISVVGGEYSIGCTQSFTAAAGAVSDGQKVCVRHMSASAFATTTRTTVFVANAAADFASTTMSAAFRAGIATLVSHYYQAALRRPSDGGGQSYWESEGLRLRALDADIGEAFYAMAMAFFGSAEYAAFNRNNDGFVTDLYATFFNRAPESGGLAYWSGQLGSGLPREVLLAQFMFSAEFAATLRGLFGDRPARAEIDMVTDFYRGLLARLPDSGGFEYWVRRFRAAQCVGSAQVVAEVEAISSAFATSGEYAARGRDPTGYVSDLYNAFLRRGGDLAGVQYWIQQVASGARTREQVRREFVASPEFSARVNAVVAQGCP